MAEEQGKHRRTAEAAIIEKELIRAQRGQTFGFVIAMMALVGGIVLLFFDKNIQGFSSIAIGLVTAFTVGRFSHARERRQKAKSEH